MPNFVRSTGGSTKKPKIITSEFYWSRLLEQQKKPQSELRGSVALEWVGLEKMVVFYNQFANMREPGVVIHD